MANTDPSPLLDVDALCREVSDWARATGPGIDDEAIGLVLHFRHDFLDSNLGTWRAGDIEELLLGVFPRKVVTDEAVLTAVPDATEALLCFLDQRGWLSADSAPLPVLLRALRRVAPQLPAVMADTSAYGPAKALWLTMLAEGIDPTDRRATEAWMRDFNSRPAAQRDMLLGDWGGREPTEPLSLPPVLVAPESELAAAARASALLAQLRRLAEWVGAGRPVTDTGVLRVAAAKAACRALELIEDPYEQVVLANLRSARDLPSLHRLWTLAVECDLVAVDGRRAGPGAALHALEGGDEDVLSVWANGFDTVIALGVDGGAEWRYSTVYTEQVDEELPGILVLLYAAGEPVPFTELEAIVWEALDSAYRLDRLPDDVAAFWRDGVTNGLGAVLDRLAGAGAVDVSPDTVALTPLGIWAVRRQLLAAGAAAPAIGELAGRPAAEMLAAAARYDERDAAAECAAWLAARKGAEAAREVTAAACGGSATVRGMAVSALELIGDDAEPAVRAALSDRLFGPYAKLWLAQRSGSEPDLDPPETLLLFVDVCAGMLESGEPEAVAEHLESLGEGMDLTDLLESLWRVDHAQTLAVLEAVGAHHPDRRVAKAARRSAFKARSRQSSS